MLKMSEKEAMEIINSPEPFKIQFVTADNERGKGGVRMRSEQAVRRGSNHVESDNGTITIEMQDQGRIVTVHRKLIEMVNEIRVIK